MKKYDVFIPKGDQFIEDSIKASSPDAAARKFVKYNSKMFSGESKIAVGSQLPPPFFIYSVKQKKHYTGISNMFSVHRVKKVTFDITRGMLMK